MLRARARDAAAAAPRPVAQVLNRLDWTPERHEIKAITLHPKYESDSLEIRDSYDVALVYLKKNSKLDPVPIAEEPAALGDGVLLPRGYFADGSRRRRGRDVDIPWRPAEVWSRPARLGTTPRMGMHGRHPPGSGRPLGVAAAPKSGRRDAAAATVTLRTVATASP